MFDGTDATQRALMLELRARRPEGMMGSPIPYDSGVAHRAEQAEERRTQATEVTRMAYQAVGKDDLAIPLLEDALKNMLLRLRADDPPMRSRT